MKNYKTIVETYSAEIQEKRSRFIGELFPVQSEEQAKEIITRLKKASRDANHHCSSYRIEGEQLLERYSDDGEPAGTAGLPMLEVLRGADLTNVLAVVTRYFGGTKLGTGGLVRAYTKATQEVLLAAQVVEKGLYIKYEVNIPYTLSGKVEYYIQSESMLLEDTVYGEGVKFILYCPKPMYSERCKAFVDLSNDQCEIDKIEALTGYVSEGVFIANLL